MHRALTISAQTFGLASALSLALVLAIGCGQARSSTEVEPEVPASLVYDGAYLYDVRSAVERGDPRYQDSVERLREMADAALDDGPFSVVHKSGSPPSGDPHDYMSIGVYWWPDSSSSDGLPYVRHDGRHNPRALDDTYDKNALVGLAEAVPTLALAHFLTGGEGYGPRAAALLRTWFIHEETRMNPHLRYGQAIPGRNDGRPIGIIETARLVRIGEAATLLRAGGAWSTHDDDRLKAWFGAYLDWLLESEFGRTEADHYNNHGTWFDVQAVYLALYTGRDTTAAAILGRVPGRRIFAHIEPDGRQPHELSRTRSFDYSAMNLRGMMLLATMAEHVDIDLWQAQDEEGRSIRAAVDYLLPHVGSLDEWPHEQITPVDTAELHEMLLRAASSYDEPRYAEAARRIGAPAIAPLLHPHALPDNPR